jgi:D-alanyl-lipoteichoic acid acyltransferase DltB (MBOAT superfamily)
MIDTGVIRAKQRIISSAWIILAYISTVLFQYNWPSVFKSLSRDESGLEALTISGTCGKIFVIILMIILLLNLIYPKIALLNGKRKKAVFLFLGVVINLFILGFFKYYNFFIDNIEWFLVGLSMDPARFHLSIILPIGISFYTFKGIGYIVDVYRGNVKTVYPYTNFALFIAFFPSLLAGPIDRGAAFMQQIFYKHRLNWNQSLRGVHLFFYGFFKKVVIADGFVKTINSVFDSTGQPTWIDVIVATLLFTIQIYCDFSGYTDMARGTAKMFGIDLMVNFKFPYFSKNPREFWSRWHISLSTWLRDYLYIPMGGNRQGTLKTHRNLIVTMVLGGLWHGAAWNFVLWGLYHGLALTIQRTMTAIRATSLGGTGLLRDGFKIAFFFIVTCYGWLLFRASSFEKIKSLTTALIFDFGNIDFGASKPKAAALFGLPILLCIEIIDYMSNGKNFYQTLPIPVWTAIYAMMIFAFVLGVGSESAQFIYFNF